MSTLRKIILELPEGTLIGRENELRTRLGCNQAMLRQVSRQLEVHGLIYIRRGPAGGYFASRPSAETVIDIAAIYLVGRGTTLEEALYACRGSSVDAARIAAERSASSPSLGTMKKLYDELSLKIPEDMDSSEFIVDEERIDDVVFEMIEVPPLQLFIKMLNKFALADFGSVMFVRQPERRKRYRHTRLETLRGILDGDKQLAAASMEQAFELIEEWLPATDMKARVGMNMTLD